MKPTTSIPEPKQAMAIESAGLSLLTAAAILIPAMSGACLAQTTSRPASSRAAIFQAASAPSGMDSVIRSASDGTPIHHVLVGHAIFVDTKTRLRRVYVADPNILNSVTLTPNEIVVTAMAPGLSSLTLLDEAGQAQNYVVSCDLDIDGLRLAMQQALGNDSIKVEGGGGRVTLTGVVGNPAVADAAAKLAALYTKDVVNAITVVQGHPKQVRLEVRILEVDRTKLLQLGINLFNPGGNTNYVAATTTSQYPSSATLSTSGIAGAASVIASNPLSFLLYSAKLNLGTTIQDLQNKQILQILAEPTITTVSGVKADFLSGGEFPFPMIQPGGAGSAPIVTISFRPFGVKVEFTPIVNADGTVSLTVAPEVSALDYGNSVNIGGFTVPALSTRRASTQVELRSNQSFAISGLLDQRTTDILDKTPGVASIPILGALFKSKNVNHSTTELIVVVTPTVVDPLTDTTVPDQPVLPIPTLDRDAFDKSLGKNAVPKPLAPPLTPEKPAMGNVPPPPPPPPTPATAPAASTTGTPATTPAASTTGNETTASPTASIQTTPPAAEVALVAPSPASAAPAPAPVPSRSSSDAGPPHSMVEIMALSHESDAEVMVAALNRHGYQVSVQHEAQDALLHLDVGPFTNEKDAETMRQRLLADGYNATIK